MKALKGHNTLAQGEALWLIEFMIKS